MNRYKDLDVWKKAMNLSESIYRISSDFPADERFGLTSQIRRAAISVPSNIAEGAGRNSKGEFNQFLGIAIGSLFEIETQLILSRNLGFTKSVDSELENIELLRKMIFGLRKSLK